MRCPRVRTLAGIKAEHDDNATPWYRVGHSSIVFKVRYEGETYALRCYTLPRRSLRLTYRDDFYRGELFVPTDGKDVGEWCDVTLERWVDGITLGEAFRRASGDGVAMHSLAQTFDRFAFELLGNSEWAHGDLSFDSIIVREDGTMTTIGKDAAWCRGFTREDYDCVATPVFRHSNWTPSNFDKSIDDFAIASLSVLLNVGRETTECFSARCDAPHYRIARLLDSVSPKLHNLRTLLAYAITPVRESAERLSLEAEDGLWGYADAKGFVIPPLFNEGFEFKNGRAEVRLGTVWHTIDCRGRKVE